MKGVVINVGELILAFLVVAFLNSKMFRSLRLLIGLGFLLSSIPILIQCGFSYFIAWAVMGFGILLCFEYF